MPLLGCCALLGACGGGGIESGGSTPSTGGSTPINSNIGNLTVSQAFSVNARTTTTTINNNPILVVNAAGSSSKLDVRYDERTRNYTVETHGRTQTFAPADARQGTRSGEAIYTKGDESLRDYLTLVTTPYSSSAANRAVGLGFWQRNVRSPNGQQTTFDSFVYGFETLSASVPRSGTANYVTDVLGFVTTPGKVPRAFTGAGTFDIDLALGIFATRSSVLEYDLNSPETRSGGGIEYTAGGKLLSGNNFAGNFTYGGTDTRVSGTLQGKFFGSDAGELGATFSAGNNAGAVVTGSFTGQKMAGGARSNLSLVNLTSDQLFYVRETSYALRNAYSGGAFADTYQGISHTTLRPDGSVSSNGANSNLPNATFTAADRFDDGNANFISYKGTVGGEDAKLSLYRPGKSNSELQLTYASFGIWEGGSSMGAGSFNGKAYRAYGLETPRDLLSQRTGTAAYSGVVYATGIRGGVSEFEVGGTSRFSVDFGAQRFSGALTLNDKTANGVDIGTWSFADALAYGLPVNTPLLSGSEAQGTIMPSLFGPDGEEVAASFKIQRDSQSLPNALVIVGATVAVRD